MFNEYFYAYDGIDIMSHFFDALQPLLERNLSRVSIKITPNIFFPVPVLPHPQ